MPLEEIRTYLNTTDFIFYKINSANYGRYVTGLCVNNAIVGKNGDWNAVIVNSQIVGNDNNDVWTFYPLFR